jgi:hypothetical protein
MRATNEYDIAFAAYFLALVFTTSTSRYLPKSQSFVLSPCAQASFHSPLLVARAHHHCTLPLFNVRTHSLSSVHLHIVRCLCIWYVVTTPLLVIVPCTLLHRQSVRSVSLTVPSFPFHLPLCPTWNHHPLHVHSIIFTPFAPLPSLFIRCLCPASSLSTPEPATYLMHPRTSLIRFSNVPSTPHTCSPSLARPARTSCIFSAPCTSSAHFVHPLCPSRNVFAHCMCPSRYVFALRTPCCWMYILFVPLLLTLLLACLCTHLFK